MLPLLVVCFYEKWEKMGWKSIGDMAGIEEAMDDIRHGRVTEYDSDDFWRLIIEEIISLEWRK